MNPPDNKPLKAEDFSTADLSLWADYLGRRIEYLRNQLERPTDGYTTAMTRGAIRECRHMGNLVEPKVIPHQRPDELGVEAIDEIAERSLRSAGPPQTD